MKLKPIGSNQTELHSPDGLVVFFSYSTPVAAFVPGKGAFVTEQKFSVTTSRHINKALERWGCNSRKVPHGEIEAIAYGPQPKGNR